MTEQTKRQYRTVDTMTARQRHLHAGWHQVRDAGLLDSVVCINGTKRTRNEVRWELTLLDGEQALLDTKRAEQVCQDTLLKLGVAWVPVAHPGGKKQLQAALDAAEQLDVSHAPVSDHAVLADVFAATVRDAEEEMLQGKEFWRAKRKDHVQQDAWEREQEQLEELGWDPSRFR